MRASLVVSEVIRADGVRVVRLAVKGHLDGLAGIRIQTRTAHLWRRGATVLEVDLGRVTSTDDSGVMALVTALRAWAGNGGSAVVDDLGPVLGAHAALAWYAR